jgi:hypothetical protein
LTAEEIERRAEMTRYLSGVTNKALEARVRDGLDVGLLIRPGNGYAAAVGRFAFWAADNGVFTVKGSFSADAFRAMLSDERLLAARDRCLFVNAPDVLTVNADGSCFGDAEATLAAFPAWAAEIRALGYPVALVAQDGLETMLDRIPWDELDAIFLGASTDWKIGEGARIVAAEAKARGKLVHMGRVNSLRRLRIADSFGCDTADGTFLAFGPAKNLPRLEGWLAQLALEGDSPALRRPAAEKLDLIVAVSKAAELADAEEARREMLKTLDWKGNAMTTEKNEAPARKVCPRCGVEKDRAVDFQHRKNGTVFSWCRDCNRDYKRERAAARKETDR